MLTYRHGSLVLTTFMDYDIMIIHYSILYFFYLRFYDSFCLQCVCAALLPSPAKPKAMSYCNDELAVPSLKWIGVFPSDIKKFGVRTIPFGDKDDGKLDALMNRSVISNQLYRELLIMKHSQHKSEIEGIAESSCSYLIDVFLKHKLDNKNFI